MRGQGASWPGNEFGAAGPVTGVVIRWDVDPWLDLRALSGYCGLSRRKLQDCLHRLHDPLPHVHLDGKVLVRRSAFDAWLQRRACRKAEALARLAAADAQALLTARPRT